MTEIADLGFDLGTTHTKVGVFTAEGQPVAEYAAPTRWRNRGSGRAEQEAGDVESTVTELLRRACDGLPPGTVVRSVGFASMAESGVLVDDSGAARSPIIAWHDTRGDAQALALPSATAAAFPGVTGLPVGHVPSVFKLAWLRDNGIDLRHKQWLSVPEYVVTQLGGDRVSERSLLGRTGLLDLHTGALWPAALDFLGVGPELLPPMVSAGFPAGRVRHDFPVARARDAVLTVAGHDHAVAAAALGCGTPGSALDSFGTAEAFYASGPAVPDTATVATLAEAGVSVYPHVVAGATGFIAGTRTGLVLKRVLTLLGAAEEPHRSALDLAALDEQGDETEDVLLSGFSMFDRDITLTLLSDSITPARLWRAAVAGGNREAAALLAALRRADVMVDRLVIAGGWTRMASVVAARRTLADHVEVSASALPGAAGAAALGRWAASGAGLDSPPGPTWFTAPYRPSPPQLQEAAPR